MELTESAAVDIIRKTGAVLTGGHFAVDPRYHSDCFVVKELLGVQPQLAHVLGANLAIPFLKKGGGFQVVVSPAVGAIPFGNYAAEHRMLETMLGTKFVYAERGPDRKYRWKRPFAEIVKGQRVLIVEDLVFTGKTARQLVDLVKRTGGTVVGVSALWNCGGATEEILGTALRAIINIPLSRWTKKQCPMCAEGRPINTTVGYGRRNALR